VAQSAHGTVGECLERHGLARCTHRAHDLGNDVLAHHLELGRARGAKLARTAGLAVARQAALEQKRHEVHVADLAVADRRVGCRRMVVGEYHRAPGMGAQAMQHRREVGVAGEDDELVELRIVIQDVADVHHHADIGGILELGRERGAVDDLEPGAQEVMAHERERVHVGRVVVGIAARHGVAITADHGDAPRHGEARAVGRRDEATALDLPKPQARVLGEALGGFLALSLQRQIDIVVVDKNRTQNRSS
jgi:hypothetical protein